MKDKTLETPICEQKDLEKNMQMGYSGILTGFMRH
jgi:hypothetical protein